jgi:hypothetical protein
MAVYSYSTEGIFPVITRALLSDGLGSFSYTFNPGIVELYNELNYGGLSFNLTPVTTTETVDVDSLNATLSNTVLSDTGTGTGTTGGFNIGRHIRFNSTNKPRTVEFSLPNDINSSLTFEVIRGSDNNGGEDPDTVAESLNLEYYNGSSWTSIDTVVAHNDTTFNTLKSVEITIPSVARTAGTQFRLIQPDHSGNNWDHYGFKSLTYTYTYTPSLPTINYGSISDVNATEVDHGRIIYVTIVEPFGFVKVVNGASWSATNTFEGRGIAFTFGKQTSPAVYGYIVDGKVKGLGGEGLGVFSTKHNGAGSTSILGQSFIGLGVGIHGAGNLFTISSAEDKFQSNWVGNGYIGLIKGEAKETVLAHHEGFGDLFTLSNGRQRSTNSFVGSGVLKLRSDKKERIAESYIPSDCNDFYEYNYGHIDFTGCTSSETVTGPLSGSSTVCEVKVELGTTSSISQQYQVLLGPNEPSTIVDLGQITTSASPQHDYGHIHVSSDECPFGLFRIDRNVGAADKFLPTWTSRGYIGKLTGEASVPLDVSVFGTGSARALGGDAITNFSLLHPGDGQIRVQGTLTNINFTLGFHGSGFIPTLSGAAESTTFNPVEKQILFSPYGEARVAFKPNWIGEGVLFTFNSVVEKSVYDYVGSGRLFGFNSKEEARVYVYNCESIVEFETPDYGFVERCLSSEIISGDISGDTSACTSKIEEGTTARVVSGQSYKIALNSDIADEFIDYGYVRDAANARIDYGNILDTPRQGLPGCIYGEIEISGSALSKLQPTYIGEGFISKLTGEATVPLDVSVPVFGTIGTLRGESVPNFSLLHPADGQFSRIFGTLTNFNFTLGWHGSGTIPKLGGASEVVTFNPDEKQMLFSFTGEREDTLTKAWTGSGNLFTIQTAVERRVYDYVGSGRLFGFNNTEERRVYSYNCSSIVEFETPDYGFVQSCSVLESISGIVSGQTLACTSRVDLGSTASIDGSYQIDLPDHIASEFISYGSIVDLHNAVLDYGHIFDTPREGLPGCIYGTIEIRGSAVDTFDPANVGQGTIFVDGAVFLNFSLSHIGSGSFRKLSGAAESIAIAEESTDLFDINGSGHVVITLGYIGDGNLSTIGGAAEIVTFNPPEDVPTIKLRGTSGDPGILLAHTGEGNLFTVNGGDIRVQHSYFGSGRLFGFNSKEEARTYVYDGGICVDEPDYDYGFLQGECLTIETIQGTVTGTTASCIAKVAPGTTASVDGTYRIETNDGSATEFYDYDLTSEPPDGVHDYGHILAETGVLCPAYLFKIRRGALSDFETFDWQVSWVSSGTIRVSGVARTQKVPRYNGDGQIFAINGAAESLTVNPVERQMLFSFTGELTESFTPAPEIGSGNLFTFNNLVERISNDYVGAGTFVLSGESTNSYTPNFNGSGTLRKFTGTAESLTVNPVERQMLFSFTGELGEAFIANPPEEGTEIKLSGTTEPEILTFAEQPEIQISVSGTAIQRYRPHVIGSGSFRKLSGAAESLTVNPDEKQLLFSFTGGITSEKHTEVYVGVDTPIRIRRGALTDFETFDWQPSWVSQGTVKVTGDVFDKWVPNNVGFGNIFNIGGSAEAVTFNPDEKQMLFSFTGTRSNESTTTIAQAEGGSLFSIGGAVESYSVAPVTDGLYRISGEAFITASLLHIGSGTFRKFSGAAESLTVNPDEKQLLFSFTGTLIESFGIAETKQIEVDIDGIGSFARSFAHSGIGSIRITGDSTNRFVVNNIGFGNIFNIGGSAEAVTFNPDEKQMLFSFTGERISEKRTSSEVSQGGTISITGTSGDPLLTFAEQPEVQISVSGESHTTRSRDHVGSGSLFAFSGAAESTTAEPPTDTALFSIQGESTNKFVANYIGSGTFKKFSGAAEAVTFNPDEKQMLFSFVGAGTEKTTAREISQGGLFKASGEAGVLVRFAHTGEGTISTSGNAHTTRSRDFVGSGFIPTLSGAAESITFNPDEKQMLFSFVGTRDSEKITARELGTPGEFTLQGTSGDPLLTFAEKSFGNVVVSGISTVVRTQAFAGSGRLFGFANGDEAYARAPYVTSGTINVSGNALVQIEVFQPPRAYVWII